jgi:hypothetical protein
MYLLVDIQEIEVKQAIDYVMDAIERELDIFQWSYGLNRADNRGEMSVDRDAKLLRLEVWVADNDTPDDPEIKPLIVTIPVTHGEARGQIRNLIHFYLCHEADEQIWFGNERPYYPHD